MLIYNQSIIKFYWAAAGIADITILTGYKFSKFINIYHSLLLFILTLTVRCNVLIVYCCLSLLEHLL